jgi:hypothetical protein
MDENPYQAPQMDGGGKPKDDGWELWSAWLTDLALGLFLAGLLWLFVWCR